jgi:hypothetical protein
MRNAFSAHEGAFQHSNFRKIDPEIVVNFEIASRAVQVQAGEFKQTQLSRGCRTFAIHARCIQPAGHANSTISSVADG